VIRVLENKMLSKVTHDVVGRWLMWIPLGDLFLCEIKFGICEMMFKA
jgi:hypothetical protein